MIECSECKLIRLSPQPPPAELERYYPASYWFQADSTAAGRLEELYRRFVLRDHLSFVNGKTGPLLDVGCGGGLFPGMLRARGIAAFGLDSSLEAAQAAHRLHGVPAVCGALSAIKPGGCAVVTMFHVLEHLHNPREYLETVHGLLKPGGRLIVQVPNAGCWQFRLFGPSWNGVDTPRHLHLFRERNLVSLLTHCGFEVRKTKHFSLRDNPAGLATTLAPSLDPMARRVRGTRERPAARLLKDLLYLTLTAAALPFTIAEAACRAGSTIMIEARKKA